MTISPTSTSGSPSARRWWSRADPPDQDLKSRQLHWLLVRQPYPSWAYAEVKNPRRCPCSPSRRTAWVPGPWDPGTLLPPAERWPRRLHCARWLLRARARLPALAAFAVHAVQAARAV